MFAAINLEYFGGALRRPAEVGVHARGVHGFGCFDSSLNQIVMNKRLDHPEVPSYAVEFILYHEMLHVKHPLRAAACGLQAHSPEFRAEEKRFKDYLRARKFWSISDKDKSLGPHGPQRPRTSQKAIIPRHAQTTHKRQSF